MSLNVEYKLGELDAKIGGMVTRLDGIDVKNSEEHKEIQQAIKELNVWRWKVVGAVSVLSIVVNVAIKYILN